MLNLNVLFITCQKRIFLALAYRDNKDSIKSQGEYYEQQS